MGSFMATGGGKEASVSNMEYARSLTTLKLLGAIAVNYPEINSQHEGAQEGWRDFLSATEENIATDPVYGEKLIFNPMRSHRYENYHVVDANGRRVVDLINNGIKSAKRAAQTDLEMSIEAERAEGDLEVAKIVDSLEVGEMYAVILPEPKDALGRNSAYWRNKGYREGMAVSQVYFRSASDEVLAGVYAIKGSSLPAIRSIMSRHGTHIPAEESENRYVRHGIRKFASRDEAEAFGDNLRKAHANECGKVDDVISVTELLRDKEHIVRSYFDLYIIPLSIANANGCSDSNLQALARAMLNNGSSYQPYEMRSLMRLANGMAPNNSDALFLEEKVRYALVEELRNYIPTYLSRASKAPQARYQPYVYDLHSVRETNFETHQKIAGNITTGLKAGRSYGGCATAGSQTNGESPFELFGSYQDIFGGNGNFLNDKYGSRVFICPKNGCRNERPKDKLIPKCQRCGADVSCKTAKQKHESNGSKLTKLTQLKTKISGKKVPLFSMAA